MLVEGGSDITAHRLDPELLRPGILDQRIDQQGGNPAPANFLGHERMFGVADTAVIDPGQPPDVVAARNVGMVFAAVAINVAGDGDAVQLLHSLTLAETSARHVGMQFMSDNAAPVHPAVWKAMQAADAPDAPYDNDALSRQLDARFSALFGRECAVLWAATGTAANCLALGPLVAPHGGVVCHREAHIEADEAGAPGFYLHGAKLMLAEGPDAKLTPQAIAAVIDPIRDDVHQVQPHAISITQASELGCAYRPAEVAAIGSFARERKLRLHMDGARIANAVAFLGCSVDEACGSGALDALSFGFVKNGGMGAEAIVFFDPELAFTVRYRRKRAGHLQSKGRFLAAQIIAMLDNDVWLDNARAANAAAQELASAAGGRLLHPVEANEVFLRLADREREALRAQGFSFYDWGSDAARLVTAWSSNPDHVSALAKAIAAL